jgi:hypothetical protein
MGADTQPAAERFPTGSSFDLLERSSARLGLKSPAGKASRRFFRSNEPDGAADLLGPIQ